MIVREMFFVNRLGFVIVVAHFYLPVVHRIDVSP